MNVAEDFSPPPTTWPEYSYTPAVGDRIKMPTGGDVYFTVVSVSEMGLRAFPKGGNPDMPVFFARRPEGDLRQWVKVES